MILMHKNFMWNNIMRTTLGLSEELLAKAMSASQNKTKQNKDTSHHSRSTKNDKGSIIKQKIYCTNRLTIGLPFNFI